LWCFVAPCNAAAASITPHTNTDSNYSASLDQWRLGGVVAAGAAGITLVSTVYAKNYWQQYPAPFNVNADDDYRYALNSDKFGHFFSPQLITHITRNALEWSGVERRQSLYWAAGTAAAVMTYLELRDGYSRYGFSWGDVAADIVGAVYPIFQETIPSLRNFNFKISYAPSERFLGGSHGAIIDDYESTYNWLSINVHGLLPPEAQCWYPPFLNVAIGHSVKGLNGLGAGWHEVYLSLDWNLEGIPLEGTIFDGELWKFLRRTFNFYRLPAPAVRILPTVVWYGLKF
jgi:Predicted periplasmic lipoprotein (DUF2279)